MKRVLASFITILLMCISLYATPEPYIRQYSSSFTVDLNANYLWSHKYPSSYNGADATGTRVAGKYYQNQELGVIGVSSVRSCTTGKFTAECSISIEINLPSNGWYYHLAGSEYNRPYGLDLFARGKLVAGSGNDTDIHAYSTQLGKQDGNYDWGSNKDARFFFLPKSVVVGYDSIWWDMCLVLDPLVQQDPETEEYYVYCNSEMSYLQPSNQSYTTDIEITITCWDFSTEAEYYACPAADLASHKISSRTFPIHLEGFFKPDSVVSGNDSSRIVASVSLEKKPGADDIAILNGNNTLNLSSVHVAKYSLMSSSKDLGTGASRPTENGKIYMFLSSSRDGFSSEGYFALKHTHDLNCVYINPFVFEVTMTSTKDFGEENLAHKKGDTSSRSVTFDGRTYFNINNGTVPANIMQVDPEITLQKRWYARWIDSGTIEINLTGKVIDYTGGTMELINASVEDYMNGQYTANIYIHIISDIN